MTDDSDKLQKSYGSVNTTQAPTVSGSPGLEPNTPSPRKRFTRKSKKPTSTYQMFSSLLEQEAQEFAKAQKVAEARKVAKAQKAAAAKAAAEQAAAVPRPKRQRRLKAFFGDEADVTVGRGRAASGQKGKGPNMQARNDTGAELSATDHGAAAESFQDGMAEGSGELAGESQGAAQSHPNIAEVGSAGRNRARKHKKEREATRGPAMQAVNGINADVSNGAHGAAAAPAEPAEEEVNGKGMSEELGEGTGGLQGGAHPDPCWNVAESEEKQVGKKDKRKRKAGKMGAGTKSVKELLDAQGVAAQKRSDADFTGFCPHCNQTGQEAEPWRHAVKAPYAGQLVCSKCGIWDLRHPYRSLVEKSHKGGERGADGELQDVEEHDGSAALEPDHKAHMAAMSDLAQQAQFAQPAEFAQVAQPALAAASVMIDLPFDQLLTVTALLAQAPADPSAKQQAVQSAAAAVLGQGASGGEQDPAMAVTSDEVQRNANSRGVSAAHQSDAVTAPSAAWAAAWAAAEQQEVRSPEGGVAVVGEEAARGEQQVPVAFALNEVRRGAESSDVSGRGGAAHAAAHELMSGIGAIQQSAAEAIDKLTAGRHLGETGVESGSPKAAGVDAASAAVLAQHAGMEGGSVPNACAAQHGMQGTKRAADEEEDVYLKRRRGVASYKLLANTNDSITTAMQLDIAHGADVSMRRTVRRRAVG